MDNDYPQTLLNSIWATINKCLPNWYLSSGEQPGQVLSVKIINSSAQIEPESFKLGQNNSSLSHLEVLEYTHTSNLFENNSGKRTNLFSHEEAAAERTSNKVPTKAFQPRTSEEHRTTLAAERVDNPVEVSTDEDVEYAVTTESERYKKSIIPFTEENISKHFGKPLKDAAEIFGVSRSTFKRICRGLGIERWRYGKRRLKSHSSSKLNRVNDEGLSIQNFSHLSMAPLQVRTASQTSQEINVKATYNKVAIRFELLDSSGMAELEDNLIERLKLERDAFSIKYKDEEGDWVLIACDKDVQKCIEITRSLGKTIITMLVDPPISHYGS
ncbi:protein NLP3-like [Apium graveolens]|uniref:protein NLP3-like n=1 Tax=Apium graveolens TaxID=4045 RepID=UPI003D7AC9EE